MTHRTNGVAEEARTAALLARVIGCDSVSRLQVDPAGTTARASTWDGSAAFVDRPSNLGATLVARLVAAAHRRAAVPIPRPSMPAGWPGCDHLAIPLHGRDGRLVTWLLTRAGAIFEPVDVDHATLLVPGLLGHLDRLAGPGRADRPAVLTARELDVLRLVEAGLTAAAAGRRLRISERTVRKHLEHIYAKLGCTDRLTAVLHARAADLL